MGTVRFRFASTGSSVSWGTFAALWTSAVGSSANNKMTDEKEKRFMRFMTDLSVRGFTGSPHPVSIHIHKFIRVKQRTAQGEKSL